jgi:hypothetical protein
MWQVLGDRRHAFRVLAEKREGKEPLGRPIIVDFTIILKWILKNSVRMAWSGFISPRIGTIGGRL